MLFRQLFDRETSTYTYLLADEATREAILIDPVLEQIERDLDVIQGLGLTLRYALDTHVHADHVTAVGALRERLGARTVVSERAGVACADVRVKDGDAIRFGAYRVDVLETPGHTAGCVTYVTGDRAMAFTGDALLIRGCGRTDFQQGDAHQLFHSVHDKLFTLPAQTAIYPAHDYHGRMMTTIDEERRLNPRLGDGRTEDEFVAIMSKLALAYPKRIDVALPRNARCGSELVSGEPPETRPWAPVELSLGGIPEVLPEWVAAHAEDVRLIDVREPDELRGELGHIEGAACVPLANLAGALQATPRDRPLVFVCRSGGRSGKAALAAAGLGFAQAASMHGGLIAWNQRHYPVTRQAAT
jgi:glyoxylase-like metal-dependent hydrolase (beta-lactamase superfamily II)/rhodanese-related sulfurtransferase